MSTNTQSSGGSAGVGFGAVIAIILSWSINHSVWWCLLHGFFGWFYILYLCMGFGGGFDAAMPQ